MFAWGRYGGALKQAIAALKYNNHPQLARPLGHWLGQAWLSSPVSQAKSLTVIPIPMHPDKWQERGFNQAELIARSFCEQTGLPLQSQGLIRVRHTEAQFGLSAEARVKNLSGAFRVGAGVTGQLVAQPKTILLVDDIYTTGATANAAAQALHQHQVAVYGVVAIAKTVSYSKG